MQEECYLSICTDGLQLLVPVSGIKNIRSVKADELLQAEGQTVLWMTDKSNIECRTVLVLMTEETEVLLPVEEIHGTVAAETLQIYSVLETVRVTGLNYAAAFAADMDMRGLYTILDMAWVGHKVHDNGGVNLDD